MVDGVAGAIARVEAGVRGVIESPPRHLEAALTNYANTTHQLVPSAAYRAPAATAAAAAPHTSIVQEIQTQAYNWSPVLMILFFAALLYVMWRTLKVMPRVKPQQIKPASDQSVSLADIAGVDEAKDELRGGRRVPARPQAVSRTLGAKVPKGVLLHGPPGTGKTLLAKAVAHESGAQFFAQSAASFVEMFAGLGAARIRRLFAIARKHEPAIIFIDELDAVGGPTRQPTSRARRTRRSTSCWSRWTASPRRGRRRRDRGVEPAREARPGAAAPGPLRPPGVRRAAGRARARRRARTCTRATSRWKSVDLGLVAQQTSGLTGADLANICNEAAIFAARRRAPELSTRDFDSALERVIAGVQSRRVLNEHEKQVVAFHEAGHALCGELLPSVDRVHRISIVPRGQALGYTLNLPDEDRYLKTREELLDHMTVLLGGRVAEQIVFGAITTGASDDLKRVAAISHAMVARLRDGHGRPRTLRRTATCSCRRRRCGSATRSSQDLVEEAQRAAQRLIVDHRRQLDALAHELLEREVLERDSIDGSWTACRGWSVRRVSACASSLPRAPPTWPAASEQSARDAASSGEAARTRIDCGACSPGSTTSASPSRISTPRSSSTATRFQHRPSCTARSVEEQGVEAVLLDVGENHVELLAPLGPDTPVGKFLAKKGPGLHHVAYQVDDIDATLGALQAGRRCG